MLKIEPVFDRKLIVSLLILLLIITYFLFRSYKLNTDGVYTVCQVDHFEPADSGASLYIDIFYQGKKYRAVANSFCGNCNGKYFFVRIIRNQPEGAVIFLDKHPVPDCILNDLIPEQGWDSILTQAQECSKNK